jgi:glucosamine kinase
MPVGYLDIDAGGTHCRARLVSASGEIVGKGEAGAVSPKLPAAGKGG